MRYPLDISEDTSKTFLFWLTRYMKYKTTTLSTRSVKNQKVLENAKDKLSITPDNISTLSLAVREVRRAGIEGIKVFYIPCEKLYHYISRNKLSTLKEIDDEVLFDFLSIATASLSSATKKNYRNALNNFFNYISTHNENNEGEGDGYIYHHDLSRWQSKTLGGAGGKKTPDYLNEEEVKRFFLSLSTYNFVSDRSEVFYNLLPRMLYLTGFRISELLSLEKKNIAARDGRVEIWVRGKGDKERTSSMKIESLEPHFSQWKRLGSCPDKMFFCSIRDEKKDMNPSSVSHMIEKLLLNAGLAKRKRGAHLFRHTFGTQAYARQKDLALVQDMMGHADPTTTRVYTHIDREKYNTATDSLSELLP